MPLNQNLTSLFQGSIRYKADTLLMSANLCCRYFGVSRVLDDCMKKMLLNTLTYLEFFFEIEGLKLIHIYVFLYERRNFRNGNNKLCTCDMKLTGILMNKLLLHLISAKE